MNTDDPLRHLTDDSRPVVPPAPKTRTENLDAYIKGRSKAGVEDGLMGYTSVSGDVFVDQDSGVSYPADFVRKNLVSDPAIQFILQKASYEIRARLRTLSGVRAPGNEPSPSPRRNSTADTRMTGTVLTGYWTTVDIPGSPGPEYTANWKNAYSAALNSSRERFDTIAVQMGVQLSNKRGLLAPKIWCCKLRGAAREFPSIRVILDTWLTQIFDTPDLSNHFIRILESIGVINVVDTGTTRQSNLVTMVYSPAMQRVIVGSGTLDEFPTIPE